MSKQIIKICKEFNLIVKLVGGIKLYKFSRKMLEDYERFHNNISQNDVIEEYKLLLMKDCSKDNIIRLINDLYSEVDMLESSVLTISNLYTRLFSNSSIDTDENVKVLVDSFLSRQNELKQKYKNLWIED